jgi:hypothetical protein
MAMAREGFAFLSDDRTYCSVETGELAAWGIGASVKLRSEARMWFKDLVNREPTEVQDGESVLRFDPEHDFGLKRAKFCQPECLIFLEQHQGLEFCVTKMSSADAAERIDQELMAEPPALFKEQRKIIDRLIAIPCWNLRYGGHPAAVARKLTSHFEIAARV